MRKTGQYPFIMIGVFVVLTWSALVAQAQAMIHFDLPAQPLADSLRAVGSQTSTNILFDAPLVAGRKAPALKADLTTDQALSRLLAGTGITHEFLNETTVILAGQSAPKAASQSANATAADIEITAPTTHTRKNSAGCGRGPAMSFAVRKIDDPIIPPASRRIESSRESPRTRPGAAFEFRVPSWVSAGDSTFLSDPQFVRRFQWRAATPADHRRAVPACERVRNLHGALGTIENWGRWFGWRRRLLAWCHEDRKCSIGADSTSAVSAGLRVRRDRRENDL